MFRLNRLGVERDLLIIDFLTLILVLVVSVSSSTLLRSIFGLPFVLFFPGYVLIAAVFPRKESLSNIERIVFSFGLSLAVIPIIGLILDYTWSIKLYPILISLSFFILAMSTFAWYKRRGCPPDDRFSVSFLYPQHFPSLNIGWKKSSGLDRTLSILLIASILIALGTMTYIASTPTKEDKFTEFYILGVGEVPKAENYPKELTVGDNQIPLTIVNHEHETTSYRVEVWINDTELKETEIGQLSQGEKREPEIIFTILELSSSTKLSEPSNFVTLRRPTNSTELVETTTLGQNVLAVAKTDNFEVGDYLQIGSSDADDVEFVQIEDIDTNESEITLSTGLRYAHNQGETVWKQTLLKVHEDEADGFEVGDYLQIGSSDADNVEFAQIEDIDINESEITLSTGLKYVHDEGEEVIEKQRLEFRLFKNEDSEPYLQLHLYVSVIEAEAVE